MAGWQRPSQALHKSFAEILSGYKNLLTEEQWQQTWRALSPSSRQALSQRYNM